MRELVWIGLGAAGPDGSLSANGEREISRTKPEETTMQANIISKSRLTVGAAVTAVALALSALAATPADARPAQATKGSCVQAGIGTLQDLGLLQAAARQQIDYSTLADPVAGPIFADLPEGSFLSLGQVVKLHTTNPELFVWCS